MKILLFHTHIYTYTLAYTQKLESELDGSKYEQHCKTQCKVLK